MQYYVYIMASFRRTLYIGVTNNLQRRVLEHQRKMIPGSFTSRYNINRLVYFETMSDVRTAIAREKQLKGWLRCRKLQLIEQANPTWHDLSAGWL